MGTRNLTLVIDRKGDLKVAQYGQWDGYPEGQGINVLAFAKDQEKMDKLEKVLEKVKFFNDCHDIDEYIKNYDAKCEQGNRTDADKYWFNNLITRDLCSDILNSLITLDTTKLPKEHNGIIYLQNSEDFGRDSLMCEWAYCINLKNNKLECYHGFNKDKSRESEMFKATEEELKLQDFLKDYKYYGIYPVKEYNLNNLPEKNKFVKELNQLTLEEDEE